MSNVIKARVLNGRYKGETVRITNVSIDEMGRKNAACFLSTGQRANIPGAASSRTLTQTKNMQKNRPEIKSASSTGKTTIAECEECGAEYNLEERKGQPGKITQCESCATEAPRAKFS